MTVAVGSGGVVTSMRWVTPGRVGRSTTVGGCWAAAVTHNEYLCAGRFTAADVAVGYALLLAQHLGLAPQFGPATQAYWQRLQARPGYQRAMAAQLRAAVEQGVPTTPAPDTQP